MVCHLAADNNTRIEGRKEADGVDFGHGEEVGDVGGLYCQSRPTVWVNDKYAGHVVDERDRSRTYVAKL